MFSQCRAWSWTEILASLESSVQCAEVEREFATVLNSVAYVTENRNTSECEAMYLIPTVTWRNTFLSKPCFIALALGQDHIPTRLNFWNNFIGNSRPKVVVYVQPRVHRDYALSGGREKGVLVSVAGWSFEIRPSHGKTVNPKEARIHWSCQPTWWAPKQWVFCSDPIAEAGRNPGPAITLVKFGNVQIPDLGLWAWTFLMFQTFPNNRTNPLKSVKCLGVIQTFALWYNKNVWFCTKELSI